MTTPTAPFVEDTDALRRLLAIVTGAIEPDDEIDPDHCDVATQPVTDEQDERNSRPWPY